MKESDWDRMLKIKTSGRDDSHADCYCYPYEPTPYSVLMRLADSGYLTKKNVLLDYGCGKGRVGFFLSYQLRCLCIGIEVDERMIKAAEMNREKAAYRSKVEFVQGRAENYRIPACVDRIYFFNPFSAEILQRVIARIKESWYRDPRRILLFFYYPSDEYISYLITVEEMLFLDEIDCRDLFEGDNRQERIIIFELMQQYK